jgi:hypothetical protein
MPGRTMALETESLVSERDISAVSKMASLIKWSSHSKRALETVPGVFPCHREGK